MALEHTWKIRLTDKDTNDTWLFGEGAVGQAFLFTEAAAHEAANHINKDAKYVTAELVPPTEV